LAAAWQRAAQAALDAKQRMGNQQPFQFNYGRGSVDRDVILGHLFQKEAERQGIVVSDEAIEGFIEQVTEGKLSSDAFRELLREMQTPAKAVYDALRQELMGRYFFVYSRPQPTTTPAELWSYYRRMNVREKIEAAELPVSEFTSQVSDPSDSELKTYFAAHKNRLAYEYPDMEKAGFKQPQRAQLQYMTVSYEEVEKTVPEVTEQEIADYYEKNKEAKYRNRPFPEIEADKQPEQSPAEEKAADEKPAEAKSDENPAEEKPAEEKAPEKPATEEKSADEKPAEEKPPEETNTEEKNTEKPAESKPEEKKDAGPTIIPDKPAEEKPSEEKKQSRRSNLKTDRELADAGSIVQSAFFNLEDKPAESEEKQEEAAE